MLLIVDVNEENNVKMVRDYLIEMLILLDFVVIDEYEILIDIYVLLMLVIHVQNKDFY